ncbi:MAG: PD40 domain-containing protein [Candidatus Eisenbacteria bacterium]|nr:PD40 domain-containing protein [Candidatus Eisenbacteria bacterium]
MLDSPKGPSLPSDPPTAFRVGEWTVRPRLNRVERGGKTKRLEPRLMHLLLLLADRAGEAVGRGELIEAIWGDVVVNEESLTQAVSKLRRVFGDESRSPLYIETIPKTGYRLVASVDLHADDAPSDATPRRGRTAWRLAVAFLVPTAVLAAALLLLLPDGRESASASSFLLDAVPFTSYPGREITPAVSPDGRAVAFAWDAGEEERYDLYLKQVNTETPLRLTDLPGDEYYPAWSPDGTTIAFFVAGPEKDGIYTVPAIGGPSRLLVRLEAEAYGLDWSPDGGLLVFSAWDAEIALRRLYYYSFEDRAISPATEPPDLSTGDITPAFSPDGGKIAFLRGPSRGEQDLFVLDRETGSTTALTHMRQYIRGVDWTPGGESLFFSSGTELVGDFFLGEAFLSGAPLRRYLTRERRALRPSIARKTGVLVFEQQILECSVNRAPLGGPGEGEEPVIRSTRSDYDSRLSPQGDRIAFLSTRTGQPELFVCGRSGEDPRRLSRFETAVPNAPIWSPDGSRVALRTTSADRSSVWVIDVVDGAAIERTLAGPDEYLAGWTGDGNALYLVTMGKEGETLQRVPADGTGEIVPVRNLDVIRAAESADGESLIFTRIGSGGIWKTPLGGGPEETLVDIDHDGALRSFWKETKRGLYFVRSGSPLSIGFLDYAADSVRSLGALPAGEGALFGLDIAPDGRSILIDRIDRSESDLSLVRDLP